MYVVQSVCEVFENEMKVKVAQKHSFPSFGKDLERILSVLKDAKVFSLQSGRNHCAFQMTKGVLENFKKDKYLDWIKQYIPY